MPQRSQPNASGAARTASWAPARGNNKARPRIGDGLKGQSAVPPLFPAGRPKSGQAAQALCARRPTGPARGAGNGAQPRRRLLNCMFGPLLRRDLRRRLCRPASTSPGSLVTVQRLLVSITACGAECSSSRARCQTAALSQIRALNLRKSGKTTSCNIRVKDFPVLCDSLCRPRSQVPPAATYLSPPANPARISPDVWRVFFCPPGAARRRQAPVGRGGLDSVALKVWRALIAEDARRARRCYTGCAGAAHIPDSRFQLPDYHAPALDQPLFHPSRRLHLAGRRPPWPRGFAHPEGELHVAVSCPAVGFGQDRFG